MSVSRKTARDGVTALFQVALTGAGNPVQAVYGYQKSDFSGQSPVVLVLSAGSDRQPFALNSAVWENEFLLDVLVFVADADGATWTDEDVENKLDEIEAAIANTVANNRKTATWAMLDYAGKTAIVPAVVSGNPYKLETIQIGVKINDI